MIRKPILEQEYPTSGQSCSTRGWDKNYELDAKIKRALAKDAKLAALLGKLIELHRSKMPKTLRDGQCLTTELDTPRAGENIFLMTSCGAKPTWDGASSGRAKLWTLMAFPSSF
jgi:hypothetical protein